MATELPTGYTKAGAVLERVIREYVANPASGAKMQLIGRSETVAIPIAEGNTPTVDTTLKVEGDVIGVAGKVVDKGATAATLDIGVKGDGNADELLDAFVLADDATFNTMTDGDGTAKPKRVATPTVLTLTTDADMTAAGSIYLEAYMWRFVEPA